MRFLRLSFAGLVAGAIGLAPSAFAQGTGAIAGVVLDSAGRPIGGTEIWVATTFARVRSDSAGRFRLVGLRRGNQAVHVRRLGFAPLDTTIRIAADSIHALTLVLARQAVTLDSVVVSASCISPGILGFLCRQRAGRGVFLEVDSIDALDAGYRGTGDLFRNRKGFRMEVTKFGVRYPVATSGWQCLVTLVNGRPGGPRPQYLSEINAVEIYTEPSEVPKQFEKWSWKGAYRCSLVVYWTQMRGRRPPGSAPDRVTPQTLGFRL